MNARMLQIVLRNVRPVPLLGALLVMAHVPAHAQSTTPEGKASPDVVVRIETALGNIDIAVDVAHAPVTSANFLKYVDGHFYDGGRFHRATRPDNYTPALPNRPSMEIIQGGINPDRRRDAFPAIPLERTSVTGLKHVAGVVSMARAPAADTATSDFFILLDDQPSLDFGGHRFDDSQGAAAFGRVLKGMDVVRRIQQQPVQGQSLTPPVPIVRMTRMP
jgi:peptidyl-prolyl cis-trans isomerase A (cyclophilin A)